MPLRYILLLAFPALFLVWFASAAPFKVGVLYSIRGGLPAVTSPISTRQNDFNFFTRSADLS